MISPNVSKRYTSILFVLFSLFTFATHAGEIIPIGEYVSLPVPTPSWKKKIFSKISEASPSTIQKWSHLGAGTIGGQLALVQAVNTWVNSQIKYTEDKDSIWRDANESLELKQGDCEDFAITKMQVLENLGVPQENLFLVIAYDQLIKQEHAFLLVRTDQGYFALQNATDIVIPSAKIRDYIPRFAFSGDEAWSFGRLVTKDYP